MSLNKVELFIQVKQLCDDYYHRKISFDDYRKLRTTLLKEIDARYNRHD